MSISGTYAISLNTPLGSFSGTIELQQEGASLRGKLTNEKSVTDFTGGKVDGDSFEFTLLIPTSLGKINSDIHGRIEGDKLFAEASIPFGTIKIQGDRI